MDDYTFDELVEMVRAELPLKQIWTVASQDEGTCTTTGPRPRSMMMSARAGGLPTASDPTVTTTATGSFTKERTWLNVD